MPRPHYAHAINALIRLFAAGELSNVKAIDVESQYGFTAKVTYHNGAVRFIRGAAVDVNTTGAAAVAGDKGYAKAYLSKLGYNVPVGKVFIMPRRLAAIQGLLQRYDIDETNTLEAIPDYVLSTIGFPCFIKSNDGARGENVYLCAHMSAVHDVLKALEQACVDLVLVEQAVQLQEYRVVVYEGAVIAAYSKTALRVIGDGESTLLQLIELAQQRLNAAGRKVELAPLMPQINRRLRALQHDPHEILAEGEALQLLDAANLSAGGDMQDHTAQMHPRWQNLCIRLSRDMHLKLVGIDLMCEAINNPESAYSILEINAAPSLSNFAQIGDAQARRVDDLYHAIFDTPPG